MKSEKITQDESDDRAKRTALLKKIPMRDEHWNEYSATVRNLSEKGMGGVCNSLLDINQKMSVEFDGIGWIEGHIAWTDKLEFGIKFDKDIDPEKLFKKHRDLLAASRPFAVPARYKPLENCKRPGFS